MANDTVSDSILFPVCSDILDSEILPIHYRVLTEKALRKMDLRPSDINIKRQIEDVRERFLEGGRYGSMYIKKPFCFGIKTEWFENNQYVLFSTAQEGIELDTDICTAINANYESLMRNEYMLRKGLRSVSNVMMARAKGLQIEFAVKKYFISKYGKFYLEPDNHNRFEIPCDHDFKLNINGRIIKFDVSGTNGAGNYRLPYSKKATDYHLLAEINKERLFLRKILKGVLFNNETLEDRFKFENECVPVKRFICWLNCIYNGINYQAIKEEVSAKMFHVEHK